MKRLLNLSHPVFIGILFIAFFSSTCRQDTSGNTTQKPNDEATDYFRTLLVIGDDRSGSTTDIRKLTTGEYKDIFNTISQKGGGTVAVCLIGNPLDQSREPYILQLNPLQNTMPFDPRDTKLTLTEKSKIKLNNDKIIADNKKALEANTSKIDQFISTIVNPNIINYKPSGVDRTDLDDALGRINTLIHEPGYQNYDQITVVLLSDGVNEPSNAKVDIKSRISHPNAHVCLVGWQTTVNCFDVNKTDNYSAKEGMIEEIRNLKK